MSRRDKTNRQWTAPEDAILRTRRNAGDCYAICLQALHAEGFTDRTSRSISSRCYALGISYAVIGGAEGKWQHSKKPETPCVKIALWPAHTDYSAHEAKIELVYDGGAA